MLSTGGVRPWSPTSARVLILPPPPRSPTSPRPSGAREIGPRVGLRERRRGNERQDEKAGLEMHSELPMVRPVEASPRLPSGQLTATRPTDHVFRAAACHISVVRPVTGALRHRSGDVLASGPLISQVLQWDPVLKLMRTRVASPDPHVFRRPPGTISAARVRRIPQSRPPSRRDGQLGSAGGFPPWLLME